MHYVITFKYCSHETLVHPESIIALLALHVKEHIADIGESNKSAVSAMLWILKSYASMDAICAEYINREVFEKKSEESTGMDMNAKLALSKKRQKEAMAAMMKRQQKFASSFEDIDDEDVMMTDVEMDQPCPDCIICSQQTDSPVMYIGLVQSSSMTTHAYLPHDTFYQPKTQGDNMHLQLCGHAVHLNCWKQYIDTLSK